MFPPGFLSAEDIDQWADTRSSEGEIPRLVRRLISATVSKLEHLSFRSGAGVYLGGWDGRVRTFYPNEYVPEGESAWELTTASGTTSKANNDYEKRTYDPGPVDPTTTTYVFVTARRWSGKETWCEEGKAEGVWQDVRAYDADDLESWLELAPAVAAWFAHQIGKKPDAIEDLESFWERWSSRTAPLLIPELVTAGRQTEKDKILNQLFSDDPQQIIEVQAETQEEAVAFLYAALQDVSEQEQSSIYPRTAILSQCDVWRQLTPYQSQLLIPLTPDPDETQMAATKGHQIFIPLGGAHISGKRTIKLPKVHRFEAREALESMGMSHDDAGHYARMASRSLMSLRRELSTSRRINRPRWAEWPAAEVVIAAMLAGAWNEDYQEDGVVLMELAGTPYSEITDHLKGWLTTPEAPVQHIDEQWYIVSKQSCWDMLHEFIDVNILDRFLKESVSVLTEVDPQYESPSGEKQATQLRDQDLPHSPVLRRGIADTLALMGQLAAAKPSNHSQVGQYAKQIVREILGGRPSWKLWSSLSPILPLVAEAAPQAFLQAVEADLFEPGEPELGHLFMDADSNILSGSSPHTGLLWALETLAWHRIYLPRVARILAALTGIDPGGRLLNRPQNSLKTIFLLWLPRTAANLEERLTVIDQIRGFKPDVAWDLMQDILPTRTRTSTSTYKPKYRHWVPEENIPLTYAEIAKAADEIGNRLVEDAQGDESRWKDLVSCFTNLRSAGRDAVIQGLEEIDADGMSSESVGSLREALRNLITKHREFLEDEDVEWTLSSSVLDMLEEIYQNLEPENIVERWVWLFDHDPSVLNPPSPPDWRAKEEQVAEIQDRATLEIADELGIEGLMELGQVAPEPLLVGRAIARAGVAANDTELIRKTFSAEEDAVVKTGCGFVQIRFAAKGYEWAETQVEQDWFAALPAEKIALFFQNLPFEDWVWDHIATFDEDIKAAYWMRVDPRNPETCSYTRAVNNFLDHERPDAAVQLIRLGSDESSFCVDAGIVVKALDSLLTCNTDDLNLTRIRYAVGELLEWLANRDNVAIKDVAKLEWSLAPFDTTHREEPIVLHRLLAEEPSFFVEVLCVIYRPESGDEEESDDQSEEAASRARQCRELLWNWDHVPGTMPDGTLDEDALRQWVLEVLELAKDYDRESVAEIHVGQILACSPDGRDDIWPTEPVRSLLEELANENIERGLRTGVYNQRGTVTKALYEGGDQERVLAEKYRSYADEIGVEAPRTAAVLREVAEVYQREAGREDTRARRRQEIE